MTVGALGSASGAIARARDTQHLKHKNWRIRTTRQVSVAATPPKFSHFNPVLTHQYQEEEDNIEECNAAATEYSSP